jgi:hypothetical protein
VKNEDLIYYLKIKSQNKYLDENDKNKTMKYLNQITLSYAIENIFTSQLNYSSFTYALIFMLIPFYYYYPKFYSSGFWGIFIGLFGVSMLFGCLQKYSNIGNIKTSKQIIFQYLPLKIFLFSLIFYFIFFVLISKLNHYSLFFISIIIIYMVTTYVLRLILLVPTEKNPFIEYRASYQFNPNAIGLDETGELFTLSLFNKRFIVDNLQVDRVKDYIDVYLFGVKQPQNRYDVSFGNNNIIVTFNQPITRVPADVLVGNFEIKGKIAEVV